MLRPAKGKEFRLGAYGLEVHMPAITAELCLEDGLASTLHLMLSRLRLFKQGPHKGKLKASAAPLPKKEPWADILAPAPSPIVTILTSRKARRIDNISTRGERGDNRELKPQTFSLKCPSCGTFKECAKIRLFTTIARGLTCSNRKKSTSSTKWSCTHGTPWTRCPIHRETGFRCGAQRLHKHKADSKGTSWVRSLKAIKHRQATLNRLGSLGEPKCLPLSLDNSVGSSTFKRTLVHKKKIKRRGNRPPHKGESRLRRPELHELRTPLTNIGIRRDERGNHGIDYSINMSTSNYWRAHSGQGQPEGSITSDSFMQYSTHKAGIASGRPLKPAKRARISEPFSKQASCCKGNCPSVWTIESYCEACHG